MHIYSLLVEISGGGVSEEVELKKTLSEIYIKSSLIWFLKSFKFVPIIKALDIGECWLIVPILVY